MKLLLISHHWFPYKSMSTPGIKELISCVVKKREPDRNPFYLWFILLLDLGFKSLITSGRFLGRPFSKKWKRQTHDETVDGFHDRRFIWFHLLFRSDSWAGLIASWGSFYPMTHLWFQRRSQISEIHLFYNLGDFYWHFLEILWLFIFLFLYSGCH